MFRKSEKKNELTRFITTTAANNLEKECESVLKCMFVKF